MEELQSQEKTAEQQQEERRESIENDWRCTARQCGLTSAAWSFLAESDLLKDLEDMLGKEDARVIGALAVYMLDKGVSMNSFADWLGRVYIPGVQRYADSAFQSCSPKSSRIWSTTFS